VRGALVNCTIIDIGKPSLDDAIQIMTSAAGMGNDQPVPVGAVQIANLCKLLPLTLGIAGRLIRDLGLVSRVDKLTSRRGTHSAKPDDWTGAVSLLEQELDDHTHSAEDNIISTSLKALTGKHADNVRTLLSAFGLIPEDVKCP
jgi:hypothetical protein